MTAPPGRGLRQRLSDLEAALDMLDVDHTVPSLAPEETEALIRWANEHPPWEGRRILQITPRELFYEPELVVDNSTGD